MVAVAGILPILSQIFTASNYVTIQPAWASVALAIAVSLVALDRFFGFSSAWARYMGTGQAISAALNQFRLDWQKSSRQLPTENPTQESIDHLLDLAKTLAEKTDDLIQAETVQWVKEFRETLTEIEKSAQAQGKKLLHLPKECRTCLLGPASFDRYPGSSILWNCGQVRPAAGEQSTPTT